MKATLLSTTLALLLQTVCWSQVPVVFNLPAGSNPSNIWVQFLGGDNVAGTYKDSTGTTQTLAANTSYSLAQITSPVTVGNGAPANVPAMLVSTFNGRMYINYGVAGLQGMGAPGGSYTPSAGSAADPNYNTRYQYIEPTFASIAGGTQVDVDLSYIDFTSIALSLQAVNAPHADNNPQTSQPSQTLVNAAAASGATANAGVLPSPGDILPNASFARVISPYLGAASMYHDFTTYLQTTLPGTSTQIVGTFIGVNAQPSNPSPGSGGAAAAAQAQSYDFTATFDAGGNLTLTANTGSGNGAAPGVPPVQQGVGIGDNTITIMSTFAQLNDPDGVYGCNPEYTINNNGAVTNTTGITNDVYGRVVGDLMAGMNYGFPASATAFAAGTVGQLSSTEWWGGQMPNTNWTPTSAIPASQTPGGQGLLFARLQSSTSNYSTYSNALYGLTAGYSFPFGDRLNGGTNLLAFDTATDPNSYLVVQIMPDAATPSTPVPQTLPPPTLEISGKTKLNTTKKSYVVKGKTTGNVTAVAYQIGKKQGRAKGTTSWKFTAKLEPGKNVIKITAQGPGGNSPQDKVTITRKE